jgi:hypothetical protein
MPREDDPQIALFDDLPDYSEEHWGEMPEYVHRDLTPVKQILVSFNSREDMAAFAKLVGQTVTMKTQSIWYPEADITSYTDKRYEDEERARAELSPVYPQQEQE